MSSKLKVDELRAQLSARGLDAAGAKPTLVRRLDAALRKERKEEEASRDARDKGAFNAGKKRSRDEPEVGNGIERLREMSVKELRELASRRGLSAHGSKRELVERLSVDAEKGSEEVLEGEEIEGSKKEKLITATKKGRAVLDQHLPDHIKSNYHVLHQEGEVYDAILNQTNVGENNNKFYVIQALGYNAEKLPLGKLSKSTILKGYDVLRRISDVILQSDRKTLEQLSGEFYTVIPHDFGYKKMREFVIDTPHKLKCKLDMVAALGEIEIATKILKDDVDMQDDPLYSCYQQLHCELMPVEVDSQEFYMIKKYMLNTHAKTHANYTVDMERIFKVSRQGEYEHFRKFSNTKNRMLLWHGSRLTNWTGILSQGLRIAPPEAPVTGYMFGKGVYFADMFSKSANYCYASHESRTGVLLLCEVALGDMAELLSANYNADHLPEGKLSTKGVGGTAPDMSQFETLEDGLVVPLGQPKEQADHKGSLLYNEYIVYNVDQIRMRYIVQVNFNFKR
ncbi:poly [ADP-ribose] polymerase 2 isoform X3 [Elaeis guineensis]|uniref:Poly [ADP-ribose] polymerase n=1 Tax=Elaeis guineensis var. tenera TaxID=51953 RepID=A0A8N4F109_ELAGV|nr:poly [ADP-ribose] polymerase 2 isoform X4 [Elaeis guineensis]